jgi:hypothetical protein
MTQRDLGTILAFTLSHAESIQQYDITTHKFTAQEEYLHGKVKLLLINLTRQ